MSPDRSRTASDRPTASSSGQAPHTSPLVYTKGDSLVLDAISRELPGLQAAGIEEIFIPMHAASRLPSDIALTLKQQLDASKTPQSSFDDTMARATQYLDRYTEDADHMKRFFQQQSGTPLSAETQRDIEKMIWSAMASSESVIPEDPAFSLARIASENECAFSPHAVLNLFRSVRAQGLQLETSATGAEPSPRRLMVLEKETAAQHPLTDTSRTNLRFACEECELPSGPGATPSSTISKKNGRTV